MMFNTGDLILDAVILSIVARTPEGTYGYKITQDVRSKMDVPESTFYPLLKQMELDGYLEVYHKDLGGRSRRFYKITDSGRERLVYCQQNWNAYLQNASNLLVPGETAPAADADVQTKSVETAETVTDNDTISIAAEGTAPVMNDFDFSLGGNDILDEEDSLNDTEEDIMDLGLDFDMPTTITSQSEAALSESDQTGAVETISAVESDSLVTENIDIENDALVEDTQITETEDISAIEAESSQVVETTPVIEKTAEAPFSIPTFAAAPPVFAMEPPVFAAEPPVFPATPVEPVTTEAKAEDKSADVDDEADFMAEMALGGIDGEEEEITDIPVDSKSENELEGLLSQLRSFESNMNTLHQNKENNVSDTNIIISDLGAVAALLNPTEDVQPVSKQPATPIQQNRKPAAQEQPAKSDVQVVPNNTAVSPTTKATPSVASAQTTQQSDNNFHEIRNPETDDTVNSLVDLLKDEPVKKTGFFGRIGKLNNSDKKPSTDEMNSETNAVSSDNHTIQTEVKEAAESSENTRTYRKFQEVRNPETDDTVNSLVDLLKDNGSSSKAKLFKPKAIQPPVKKVVTVDEVKEPVVETKPIPPVQNTHKVEKTEVRSPETDDTVNSLVDLLKDDSTTSKKRFRPWRSKSEKPQAPIEKIERFEKVEPVVETKPISPVNNMPVHQIKATEMRSPETDDTMNSLVDLLREDTPTEKSSFFKSKKQKAPIPTIDKVHSTQEQAPVAKQPSIPTVSKKPVAATPVKPVASTPITPVAHEEASNAKSVAMPTIKAAKTTTATNTDSRLLNMNIVDTPANDDSVDNLVELLIGNKSESHSSSIFGKSAKPYSQKTSSQKAAKEPVEETSKSVISRPASTAKPFDVKAAATNAKPVETKATITKPLEAKAISTNPTVPKPTEAKAVETKAVATPKPATAEEKSEDSVSMDSFKYRLLQAHLIPEDNK